MKELFVRPDRSISLTGLGHFVLASANPLSRADAPVFSEPYFGKDEQYHPTFKRSEGTTGERT